MSECLPHVLAAVAATLAVVAYCEARAARLAAERAARAARRRVAVTAVTPEREQKARREQKPKRVEREEEVPTEERDVKETARAEAPPPSREETVAAVREACVVKLVEQRGCVRYEELRERCGVTLGFVVERLYRGRRAVEVTGDGRVCPPSRP
jgi:hypothetical protein